MIDDDDAIRPRSTFLADLEREELDPWSKEDLEDRIRRLEKEIERARAALAAKSSLQGVAARLFKS